MVKNRICPNIAKILDRKWTATPMFCLKHKTFSSANRSYSPVNILLNLEVIVPKLYLVSKEPQFCVDGQLYLLLLVHFQKFLLISYNSSPGVDMIN